MCFLVNNSGFSREGHSDLPDHAERHMSCINSAVSPDTNPGAVVTPYLAPPTRVVGSTHTALGEAPPTADLQPTINWPTSAAMTGHDDINCYCNICEPANNLLSVTQQDGLGFSPSALHTGWPLADFSNSTDLSARCLQIYDLVRASGAPNFLAARVPLPHQLNIPCWRTYLQGHSDTALVDYLEYGFPVGFDSSHPLESTDRNHASALQHASHVQTYLSKELSCQAMLGPFNAPPFWPWCHLNPIMTRPKKDSDERRVILDLSWPLHASVNAGTPLEVYMNEPYKLTLPTVDDFAQVLSTYGKGTYMWTMDLRRAFRQIRIDPLDWPLTCICWEGAYYIDISVAFGVRHGAAFAQRLSQAVCDILGEEHIISIPYIDDFIGGQPSLKLARAAYNRSLHLFHELGLDLNPKKCVPPTTKLIWIGVTYDSIAMTMCIPPTVITETKILVGSWLSKAKATRHDLQKLLGKLFYAGKCCPAARLFVGRMLDTLRASHPTGSTTLSENFRADLRWWRDFLPLYNGRLLIQSSRTTYHIHLDIQLATVTVRTDTQTTTATIPSSLATNDHKEARRGCYTVLVALLLWATDWAEAELIIHCVDPRGLGVLFHGRSRDDRILEVGRRIWLITAPLDIQLTPTNLSDFPIDRQPVWVEPPVLNL